MFKADLSPEDDVVSLPQFGFLLLLKNLDVYTTAYWERGKSKPTKEECQKMILTIFVISDKLERVIKLIIIKKIGYCTYTSNILFYLC